MPRIEILPPDELPAATPAIAAHAGRDALGRFTKGNSEARSQRVRPGPRGLVGVDTCAPGFRPFARWGQRYAGHRRRELAQAHGGSISAGVGAIVESAALAMAASRFLDHQARQSGDPDLFKQAAQLGQTARQHELAAWELAAREAKARPMRPADYPWLTAAPDDEADLLPLPETTEGAEPDAPTTEPE